LDPTASEEVKLALKEMGRNVSSRQTQARGLTWGEIERFLDLKPKNLRDVRDRALVAVAYDTMCRREELVSLRVEDIAEANLRQEVATDEVRKGEGGCIFDEIGNLVEPTERRDKDGSAGPQRGRTPERSGRSQASGPPMPGEGRVSRMRRTTGQESGLDRSEARDGKASRPERPGQTENTRSGSILIRRSKTDTTGEGATAYLSPLTMRLVNQWIKEAGIKEGAVFVRVRGTAGVGESLTAQNVTTVLKKVGKWIGLKKEEWERISGHSARVGAAQDLLALNIELSSVMQAGRWKDTRMPMRYGEKVLASRGGMARAAKQQGRA
jgi:integrase